jgi:hypothetical protein
MSTAAAAKGAAAAAVGTHGGALQAVHIAGGGQVEWTPEHLE